jgi:hypothetical protein
MLHLFDPVTFRELPDINGGGFEDLPGAPRVTVLGSDMATPSGPDPDPIVRQIRLSVFTGILRSIDEMNKRIARLEVITASLAATVAGMTCTKVE